MEWKPFSHWDLVTLVTVDHLQNLVTYEDSCDEGMLFFSITRGTALTIDELSCINHKYKYYHMSCCFLNITPLFNLFLYTK